MISFPMYAGTAASAAAFGALLAQKLRDAGLPDVPDHLTVPTDLLAHWQQPDLLVSQTCGYPFATALRDRVRYVATPRFRAPGCDGSSYASALVVRTDETATDITGLAGKRAAFNSRDSHSGYNVFRFTVAPHAAAGRFFADTVETGSHRLSLAAIQNGHADVAAVDAVTLALVSDAEPSSVEGLRVLAYTDRAPGLPFVTSLATADADLTRLRLALAAACAPTEAPAAALRLDGLSVLPVTAYDRMRAMEADAIARGYPALA